MFVPHCLVSIGIFLLSQHDVNWREGGSPWNGVPDVLTRCSQELVLMHFNLTLEALLLSVRSDSGEGGPVGEAGEEVG